MSNIWLCIPSARPVAEVNARMDKWRERGYRIALWRDTLDNAPTYDLLMANDVGPGGPYPGYAVAANFLIRWALDVDPSCDWIVTGGDDVDPEPNKTASLIALECSDHFRNLHIEATGETIDVHPTFGVMQPTGDRWGDKKGAYIDRVAGSPWIGREFARRMYGGKGPYWPEYTHMGVDEELQMVAQKYGVFWQRPDLTHHHDHWGRPRNTERLAPRDRMPAFLHEANSEQAWADYKRLFAARLLAGFPGSEPIA